MLLLSSHILRWTDWWFFWLSLPLHHLWELFSCVDQIVLVCDKVNNRIECLIVVNNCCMIINHAKVFRNTWSISMEESLYSAVWLSVAEIVTSINRHFMTYNISVNFSAVMRRIITVRIIAVFIANISRHTSMLCYGHFLPFSYAYQPSVKIVIVNKAREILYNYRVGCKIYGIDVFWI